MTQPRTVAGMTIEVALQTPDRAWRIEIVKRGQTHWYRIVHGDSEIEWLSIAAVERILPEAGIDMTDLLEASSEPGRGDNGRSVAGRPDDIRMGLPVPRISR